MSEPGVTPSQLDEIEGLLSGTEPEEEIKPGGEDETEKEVETLEQPQHDDVEDDPHHNIDEKDEIDEGEPATVDYEQLVPQTDGREALSIGQMKDKLTEFERTETALIDRENLAMQKLDEVNKVLAGVGDIPPALRELAEQKHAEHVQTEYRAMTETIPEMKSREGFERVSGAARQVLASYGASEQEIVNITDHRMIKMAYDLSRLRKQIDSAGETALKIKAAKPLPSRKASHISKQSKLDKQVQAAKTGSVGQKLDAIDQLIRNG